MDINFDALENYLAVKTFRGMREQFYEDLAEAVSDSEPIAKFIEVRRARALKQKDSLAVLYATWLKRMNKRGGKLSYVLKGTVPESDIFVLSAIEDKGDLAEGLRFLAKTIRDQRGMTAALIGAIVMPIIVSVVMVGFMVVLALFVVPVFVEIAPVEKWNGIGKVLYSVSYAITHYGMLMLAGGVALIAGFIWTLSNWTGAGRAIVDKHLPYSVYRDYHGALFLVALAVMMHSGDTLMRALEVLKARSTPWLRWHIVRIIRNVDRMAGNYGESFATGVFSQQLTNRIVDYSRRSSELDKVISRIGIDGIERVRKDVESGAKLMNSILIAVLGALLAFMLVGTILTAQGLSDSLKKEVSMQKIK